MKKLFTNEKFFTFCVWFAAIATIPYVAVVFKYYTEDVFHFANLLRIGVAACLIVTYFAFKNHSKNVMKGMMGAILFGIVFLVTCTVFAYNDIFSYITQALVVILFISHFVINSDHHSSPSSVRLNQILCFVFAALSCVEGILLIPTCKNTVDTVVQILECIAQPCTMLAIVCIESCLDAYRTDREAAGWTEEKGYPEGYVHEFEKKKAKAKAKAK